MSSVGTYKNHLSEHTGNYRFSCEVCDKKFNIKLSYEEHLRSHDMVKINYYLKIIQLNNIKFLFLNRKRNTFVIFVELDSFILPRFLSIRFGILIRYRKFLVTLFIKVFNLTFSFYRFECIVCKKKYRTRSALRMHDRKVHLKTPTTFCPECNKGLYSPADLKNHMVVHTGIYNYPCELCPSKFFRSDRYVVWFFYTSTCTKY